MMPIPTLTAMEEKIIGQTNELLCAQRNEHECTRHMTLKRR
jgi:hypothetical protein